MLIEIIARPSVHCSTKISFIKADADVSLSNFCNITNCDSQNMVQAVDKTVQNFLLTSTNYIYLVLQHPEASQMSSSTLAQTILSLISSHFLLVQ